MSSAGEDWPEYRESLLDSILENAHDRVDVLLYEGLVQDVVAVADRHPEDYRLIRRVAQAATDVCPDWVMRVAKHQAEQIMDGGRSTWYDYAVAWLRSAREAYVQLDDETGWRDYIAAIRSKHGRKYKLMRLIEERL